VITPFLLMGAMSPVSVPAALTQQMAEALAGIALAQLIRPGTPVIFGSFLSNTDMQSGSPSFGTPESAVGLLCTGQIARHFGLPWRSGGGLTSSQTADAQAAYEAMMTMLPTFLAGANWVKHSAGWLRTSPQRSEGWCRSPGSMPPTRTRCIACGTHAQGGGIWSIAFHPRRSSMWCSPSQPISSRCEGRDWRRLART